MTKKPKSAKTATKTDCPDCMGAGERPWADTIIKCEACNGTGKITK